MRLLDDLIGVSDAGKTLYYSGSDSKKLFLSNQKEMPIDWYYRNKEITYRYNKHGHRCKEINDLDFSNYTLFLGDSFTEGVGLELEHTYAYLTANNLNTDYYNLGLGGTGLDYLIHNLIVWLSKYPKPKYIVLFFTDHTRFLAKGYNCVMNLVENGSWSRETDVEDFLVSGMATGYFDTRLDLFCIQIKNILMHFQVPFANISVIHDSLPYMDVKTFDRDMTCVARDLQHPGIRTNQMISEYLVSYYNDKYLNARYYHDPRGQEQS